MAPAIPPPRVPAESSREVTVLPAAGSQAVVAPTPKANAPPRVSPAWMTAPAPADRRVQLAGTTTMRLGPTPIPAPPAPATPTPSPASGAQPPASPPGRTLIVRAVDPSQAVAPMAPVGDALLQLKAAPVEPTDFRFPINLATALRLSDARPLVVAAAQASVWIAEARLQQARVLWVPSLMTGVDYIRHDGGGPDFNKGVMTAASVNFLYGGSGLWQWVNLTDAIFQPLARRQLVNARHWDVQTAKNDVLLETADAYFRVHQYRGMYAGTLYCVERGHDLVERLATMSRDLVTPVEVERARNMVADLEQRAVSRASSGGSAAPT